MKKILTLLILIGFTIFCIVNLKNFLKTDNYVQIDPSPSISPLDNDNMKTLIAYNSQNYQVEVLEVSDISLLELVPNFENPKTVNELILENSCVSGVSGGFYTTSNTPVGLFISQGKIVGSKKESSLFDTIFAVSDQNKIVFVNEVSLQDARLAIQVGPTLYKNSKLVQLSIRNDKNARRIVVAKTTTGKLVFLTFFDPQSTFKGPLLQELPDILALASSKLNLKIDTAANLDGGSASAFYTSELSLEELSLVGSFFCVKTAN